MYRQRTFQTVQEARHLACRSAGHLLYGPQVKDVSGPGQVLERSVESFVRVKQLAISLANWLPGRGVVRIGAGVYGGSRE